MEIKNRYTGEVILAVEAETLRGADLCGADLYEADLRGADLSRALLSGACLSEADLSEADLRGANLYGADLSEANLCGADLSRAILADANLSRAILSRAILSGAVLWDCIGNGIEVKSLQCGTYCVTYTAEILQIGSQRHEIGDWWAFDDEKIAEMDSEALDWWRVWKPILQAILAASPAEPTGAEQ